MASTHKRKNGIYYTPKDLAFSLAKPLINKHKLTVFDPAYGEGSLLIAAEKIFNEIFPKSKSLSLFGCDKLPKDGLLKHLPSENFIRKDFFQLAAEVKYDIIISNPPFVRHHLLSPTKRLQYHKKVKDLCNISLSTDLWGYFLLKSSTHLNVGGNLGIILPWSFLQADYALPIREFLLQKFGEIKLIALNKNYFLNAEERIILLWLFNYGKKNNSIKLAYSKTIQEKIKFDKIDSDTWLSRRVTVSSYSSIKKLIDKLKSEHGFEPFGDIANIKIGVVTGADDHFIFNNDKITKYKLDRRKLQPIISSFRNIQGFLLNGTFPNQYLIKINKQNFRNHIGLIRKFREDNIHLRAHSMRRDPWYSVIVGKLPDAFFPYRISKCPYLILNNKKFQSTNSVHRIYFKEKLSSVEIQCLQLSLLTYPSQLSLESNSKIYGSGVLKIEPSSLQSSIIHIGQYRWVKALYNKVNDMLLNDQKEQVLELVSNYFYEELKVSPKMQIKIRETYDELLSRRINRQK